MLTGRSIARPVSDGSNIMGDIRTSVKTGAIPSAFDSGTACALAAMRNESKMVTIPQQPLPDGGVSPELISFSETKPWLSAAQGAYKYLGGAATVAAYGYCVWDDAHQSHSL